MDPAGVGIGHCRAPTGSSSASGAQRRTRRVPGASSVSLTVRTRRPARVELRAAGSRCQASHGSAFRPVDRHGRVGTTRLGALAVVLVLERQAARVGLDPDKVAGHSLRAGLATSAAAAGVPERVIAAQTGTGARPCFAAISARDRCSGRTPPVPLGCREWQEGRTLGTVRYPASSVGVVGSESLSPAK